MFDGSQVGCTTPQQCWRPGRGLFNGHELAEFVDTGIFRVNLFDTDLRMRPYETRYVHARDFSLKSFESHDATPQRDYL